MKSIINILFLTYIFLSLTSCEEELLQQEQYKPVIYLKSGENNIFSYPHSLNDSISTGYITAGSGGSMPLTRDALISIELSNAQLQAYNYRNFGKEYHKYAQLLPSDCYVIPYKEKAIKAGDINATALFPIEIDANRLSPDTTYMLPIKIESAESFEINKDKNFVLYQINLMNAYTSPVSNIYKMRGMKHPDGGIKSNITANKKVVPLSKNKIRLFPENLINSTKLEIIENRCIVLAINPNNTVSIKPYKKIQIQQLNDCVYEPEKKVFTIHYRYRLPDESKWTTVFETLTRIE